MLKSEYQNQLQTVSSLKRRLNDLEVKETEDIDQLELERSLLNAEFDSETQRLSKAKMKIAVLKHKEARLSGIYDELQKEFESKKVSAKTKIDQLEETLETLDETQEDEVTQTLEQLEVEKKSFEDMEFQQMEEATHKETEREELLAEIGDLERQVDKIEHHLVEINDQQKEMLANVRQETELLEHQRELLIRDLKEVNNFLYVVAF